MRNQHAITIIYNGRYLPNNNRHTFCFTRFRIRLPLREHQTYSIFVCVIYSKTTRVDHVVVVKKWLNSKNKTPKTKTWWAQCTYKDNIRVLNNSTIHLLYKSRCELLLYKKMSRIFFKLNNPSTFWILNSFNLIIRDLAHLSQLPTIPSLMFMQYWKSLTPKCT